MTARVACWRGDRCSAPASYRRGPTVRRGSFVQSGTHLLQIPLIEVGHPLDDSLLECPASHSVRAALEILGLDGAPRVPQRLLVVLLRLYGDERVGGPSDHQHGCVRFDWAEGRRVRNDSADLGSAVLVPDRLRAARRDSVQTDRAFSDSRQLLPDLDQRPDRCVGGGNILQTGNPWESAVGGEERLVRRECPAADQNHEAGGGQTRRGGNLAHEHARAAVQPDDERKGAGALWTQDGGDLDGLTVAARAFDL